MSLASTTTNLPALTIASTNWIAGQSPIGTVFNFEITDEAIPTNELFTYRFNLSAGVWSITPNVIITSTNDDMLFASMVISQTNSTINNYVQTFYYGTANNIEADLTFTQTTSFIVYISDEEVSPLTTGVALAYTASSDATISGYIQYIRIA